MFSILDCISDDHLGHPRRFLGHLDGLGLGCNPGRELGYRLLSWLTQLSWRRHHRCGECDPLLEVQSGVVSDDQKGRRLRLHDLLASE